MAAPRLLAFALLFIGPCAAFGQAKRIRDENAIGWYVYEGDHKLGPRWRIHTEYQWRRVGFIRDWQQSLARLGAGYQLRPRLVLGGGYTHLTTHVYGDYPTADTGVPFPEHRAYQDAQLSDTLGRLTLGQRVRLEQRWIGQLPETGGRAVQHWQYQSRIRYQLAATLPLQGPRLDAGEWYLTGFDEVFLSFGRHVGSSVFNQNRLAGGVGFQVRDNFRLELLYLNQITQHAAPEPVSGLPVFEFNHGFRLGLNYDLTLMK
ncbi:Protein of unknown function [Hymenobacter daecheongensis DSM 21074]|uniref:DUF2490 domain-containing protein n=1 Tax=Hymenobacter daecheongensis DSM 21074 TaxID=1121955 RepID=A0A1M6FCC3_9BACT|nr:DUF2490 domain-containing protein [Hymenobacter daecheongensis]SHI95327.1 Protein of unknown function [Hymenobacter daecheongensis DSM 21074]